TLLATGGYDTTVRIWEVETGLELCQLQGHDATVRSVAFSPDGTTLASGGDDQMVRLWDVVAGKELYRSAGHRGSLLRVAFAAAGRTLASGSGDTTALVWDLSTLAKGPASPAAPSTMKEMETLWTDLAGKDALKAYRASTALAAAPAQTLPFLKEH